MVWGNAVRPEGEVFDRAMRSRCFVREIERKDADAMIRQHYLGKWPGVCVLTLGLFLDDQPVGVVVFALPPRETMKRYGCTTWELARLWISDSMPTNTETFFIGRAIKYIKRHRKDVEMLVSYADPSAHHSGVIYRASNWISDGRTDQERKTPRFDYACAATGKKFARRSHVPVGTEIVRVPRVSKHRFIYRLQSAQKRHVQPVDNINPGHGDQWHYGEKVNYGFRVQY